MLSEEEAKRLSKLSDDKEPPKPIVAQSMEFVPTKEEHERLLDSIINSNNPILSDHEDYRTWPMGEIPFGWEELNQDFASNPSNYRTISEIASDYRDEKLDLRLCMIERPFTSSLADKFTKILNLFRQMQLRQLLVISDQDGTLQGIITRKDLF
jgi:hypothetical protein